MDFKELLESSPLTGTVIWLGLRPAHRSPVRSVTSMELDPVRGIEDDHYSRSDGWRQVTIIQWEHFDVMEKLLGFRPTPEQLRRNIVVAGINVHALRKSGFRIGGVELEGTGDCHPCSRMEEVLGPGGYHVMRGHGGITARIRVPGTIHTGDEVLHIS
jgi:MOSC domain-containing protein YiiM